MLVRRALTTTEGITSFWTDQADIPAEVGETLKLGFPEAPLPFDLLLAQSDDKVIIWRTATFPSAMGRHRDSVGAFRR